MAPRKRVFSLLFLAFLLGCSRSGTTSEKASADAGQPVQGDWGVVRFETDPDNLNPLISRQAAARYAIGGVDNSQVYEVLMAVKMMTWTFTEPVVAGS